ncbi:threonine synthase [Actinobacillus equuli]|nr:threonine synthase [Actinobacillus equuli]
MQCRVYIPDVAYWDTVNQVYADFSVHTNLLVLLYLAVICITTLLSKLTQLPNLLRRINMKFICNQCQQIAPVSTRQAKCQCGGLWSLDYQPPKFDLNQVDQHEWSLFRYRKFIALQDESWRDISLGEGMTPIVRFDENVLLKWITLCQRFPLKTVVRRYLSVIVSRLVLIRWYKIVVVMQEIVSQPIALKRIFNVKFLYRKEHHRKN